MTLKKLWKVVVKGPEACKHQQSAQSGLNRLHVAVHSAQNHSPVRSQAAGVGETGREDWSFGSHQNMNGFGVSETSSTNCK